MPPDFSQSIRYHHSQTAKRQDHEYKSFQDTRDKYKEEAQQTENKTHGDDKCQHTIPPPGKRGNR